MRRLLHQLIEHPIVYDQIQRLFGLKEARKRLAPYLKTAEHKSLLDGGAGTGLYFELLPRTARYVGLDIDPRKLSRLRHRSTQIAALLGDATQLCLADDSVENALCVGVSHHLTDSQLTELFSEVARVTTEKLIFLDPILKDAWISRLLWRYDRGGYPRSFQALLSEIGRHFFIESVEHYAIYHHYVLCVGRSKRLN